MQFVLVKSVLSSKLTLRNIYKRCHEEDRSVFRTQLNTADV